MSKSVEDAIKYINFVANKKAFCKTRYNIASDEVEYDGVKYYKSFSYLSDRSAIYNYIDCYLEGYKIPYTIEIKYNDYYISKEGKVIYDKKLMYTIKIA
jgi:hypothetical protein